MKIFIVDDDTIFALELESMISSYGYELVGKAHTYEEAVEQINLLDPELIISDIKLDNGYTGLDVASASQALEIPVIFVTAFGEEGIYNSSRLFKKSKFIVKPFDKLTLKGMIDEFVDDRLVISPTNSIRGEYLFIRKKNDFVKVNISEVTCLHSEGNYLTLYTENSKHLLKYSLSKLLESNKFKGFMRVHRNYAVNKSLIDSFSLNSKSLKLGDKMIPIGRTYISEIKQLLSMHGSAFI